VSTLVPAVSSIGSIRIKNKRFFNAVIAAIHIYTADSKTGKLPEKLPAGLPKNMFSGRDFEYERTADGFILRCRGKDLDKNVVYQYEFKVSRQQG